MFYFVLQYFFCVLFKSCDPACSLDIRFLLSQATPKKGIQTPCYNTCTHITHTQLPVINLDKPQDKLHGLSSAATPGTPESPLLGAAHHNPIIPNEYVYKEKVWEARGPARQVALLLTGNTHTLIYTACQLAEIT